MDISEGGTQPAHSKNESFAKLERPNTWGDLSMVIGLFGFYSQFFPLYELYIRPWRYILVKIAPTRKTISKVVDGTDSELMDIIVSKVTVNIK